MSFLKQNFLLITIVPLLILTASASYVRFMIMHDYLVAYEIDCDPETQSCYIGCEDDDCTETYFYAVIERYANEIFKRCGENILECDEAYVCQPDAADCSVTFCDRDEEGADCASLIDSAL